MNGIIEGMVPIVAIITTFTTILAIAVVLILANMKKRKLEIEAYKAAIEKGLPVPEMKTMQRSPLATFKASLVWMAIGIGFCLMMIAENDSTALAFGSIPILIGIALMISYFMEKKEQGKDKEKGNSLN